MRGLAFVGDYAVVGLSRPRDDKTFGGLALEEELANRAADARCGLLIIDLRSGNVAHWLRVEGLVRELYDVATLPLVSRPMALGFKTDEIRRTIEAKQPDRAGLRARLMARRVQEEEAHATSGQ